MTDNSNPNSEKNTDQIALKCTETTKGRYDDVGAKLLDRDPTLTKNEIMAKILDVAEVGLARTSSIVSAKEIKELDYHASSMARIYTTFIDRAEASDKEHKENFDELENILKDKEKDWLEKKTKSTELINNQNEQLNQLQKINDDLENHKNEIEGHLGDKDRIIESLEEKNQEFAETKDELRAAKVKNNEYNQKIIILEKQLAESNHVNASQADQVERMNDDLKELKSENLDLKAAKSSLSSTLEKNGKHINDLIKKQHDIEFEAEKCNVKHAAAVEQIEFFKTRMEDLKDDRKAHRLEVERLRSENTDLLKVSKESKTLLSDALRELDEMRKELKEAHDKIEESMNDK